MLLVGCGRVVKVAQFALLWAVALHGSFCCYLCKTPLCLQLLVWGIDTRNCNKKHPKPIKNRKISLAADFCPPRFAGGGPITLSLWGAPGL